MTYTVNGKPVGDIGFGLMSLNMPRPKPLTDDEVIETIKTAVDCGCNYLNGGQFYGTPESNSLTSMRKYLDRYPEDAGRIVLNVKGAFNFPSGPTGSRDGVSGSIDACLEQLGPVGRIDQFEPARKDPNVDYVNETLATIDEYVKAGKIGGIACSELGPATFRQAAENHKIGALEVEFSLFHTDPLYNGLFETCAEFNIPVLAYSPMGKGFLTGDIKSLQDLPENDYRRNFPRFSPENFPNNMELVQKIDAMAAKKGCKSSQIAINWIVHVSKRPGMPKIIPIPGTASPARVRENSTKVDLTPDDMAEIESILDGFKPAGSRYPEAFQKLLEG